MTPYGAEKRRTKNGIDAMWHTSFYFSPEQDFHETWSLRVAEFGFEIRITKFKMANPIWLSKISKTFIDFYETQY